MGERKVLNKYIPPDFDPAKLPGRRRGGKGAQQIKVGDARWPPNSRSPKPRGPPTNPPPGLPVSSLLSGGGAAVSWLSPNTQGVLF